MPNERHYSNELNLESVGINLPYNMQAEQTFPKLLQQAGYQTALIGKWHLESLPTGFNYWEIVPGQGDYYNPDFITQDNDTIQKHGYITNIITDDAIDWMENKRDKDKPFCILIHHKAIHRNWLADTCNLSLYEDKTFPLPDNFFDDYEGRPAAAAQEMSIVKDMDMIYDLKMLRPDLDLFDPNVPSTEKLLETAMKAEADTKSSLFK